MSLTFVENIPSPTSQARKGKWAKVAEQLIANPGKPAIVAEYPFESDEERTRMTQRASGAAGRLKAYGASGSVRTDTEAKVVRLYGQAA